MPHMRVAHAQRRASPRMAKHINTIHFQCSRNSCNQFRHIQSQKVLIFCTAKTGLTPSSHSPRVAKLSAESTGISWMGRSPSAHSRTITVR